MFIGSTLSGGTTPLVNNQGQIINPNAPGKPGSYLVPINSPSGIVYAGVSNALVSDQGQTHIQPNIVNPNLGSSQQSFQQGGGGGGSNITVNQDGGSFDLSSLIVPALIIIAVFFFLKKK